MERADIGFDARETGIIVCLVHVPVHVALCVYVYKNRKSRGKKREVPKKKEGE